MIHREEAPPVGHNENVRKPLEAGSTPTPRNMEGEIMKAGRDDV